MAFSASDYECGIPEGNFVQTIWRWVDYERTMDFRNQRLEAAAIDRRDNHGLASGSSGPKIGVVAGDFPGTASRRGLSASPTR